MAAARATPQEVQVARVAADGHTNPEIGAQLVLSPRTGEFHLTKPFGKLGISSRKQLRSALSDVGLPSSDACGHDVPELKWMASGGT
jgi:DNA-binding NarL/FixJ family response regulator